MYFDAQAALDTYENQKLKPPEVERSISGTSIIHYAELQRILGQAAFTIWVQLLWSRNRQGVSKIHRNTLVGKELLPKAYVSNSNTKDGTTLTFLQVKRGLRRLRRAGLVNNLDNKGTKQVLGDYRLATVTVPSNVMVSIRQLPVAGGNRKRGVQGQIDMKSERYTSPKAKYAARQRAYSVEEKDGGNPVVKRPKDRVEKPRNLTLQSAPITNPFDPHNEPPRYKGLRTTSFSFSEEKKNRAELAHGHLLASPPAGKEVETNGAASSGPGSTEKASGSPGPATARGGPATKVSKTPPSDLLALTSRLASVTVSGRHPGQGSDRPTWKKLGPSERESLSGFLTEFPEPDEEGIITRMFIGCPHYQPPHGGILGTDGKSVFPPYPSTQVLKTAATPPPPKIQPDWSDAKKVWTLLNCYRKAIEAKHRVQCFSFIHGVPFAKKQMLLKAADVLVDLDIPPAIWAMWSLDVYDEHGPGEEAGIKSKAKRPPLQWVYNAQRMRKRSGWCQDVLGTYGGGRLIFGPKHYEVSAMYRKARALLRFNGGADCSEEKIDQIIRRVFGPGGWRPQYEEAKTEALKIQQALRYLAKEGDWLW